MQIETLLIEVPVPQVNAVDIPAPNFSHYKCSFCNFTNPLTDSICEGCLKQTRESSPLVEMP